jgi:hypothetical protein
MRRAGATAPFRALALALALALAAAGTPVDFAWEAADGTFG